MLNAKYVQTVVKKGVDGVSIQIIDIQTVNIPTNVKKKKKICKIDQFAYQ